MGSGRLDQDSSPADTAVGDVSSPCGLTLRRAVGCGRVELRVCIDRSNSPPDTIRPCVSKLQISGKGKLSAADPCSSSQNLRVKMTP